jgi:hypothetical protein
VSTVPPIRREILVDADPAAARAEYDHGWPLVLGRYQAHVADGSWQVMMTAGS